MELLEIIRNRRSIRAFQSKALQTQDEEKLVEAIRWAPSAGNLQSRRFYFVRNPETKRALVEAAWNQTFVEEAPLAVVGCADERIERHYGKRGKTLYCLQDVAASVQNLLLEAHALGLGGVWVGAFDEDKVKKLLQLPEYLRPVAIVPIGYPDEKPKAPPRLEKDEFIHRIA